MICDNPNYHSLCYGSTAIQTNNSFSLLDGQMNASGEHNMPKPVHSSTPKQREKTTRNELFTPLRILNVNCQSIKNKQHQIQNLVDSTKPDIVIATETWLDPTVTNSQIFPPNYNIYRKDRKGNKTGGGVLIAMNDKYLSSEVPELDTTARSYGANYNKKATKIYMYAHTIIPKHQIVKAWQSSKHQYRELQQTMLAY